MQETNLVGFGLFLEVGFVLLILWLVRPSSQTGDLVREKLGRLKKDYQRIQQEFQQSKTQLSQECNRLRQQLQTQNDQLMQEYLQRQQEWKTQEEQLVQARDRLQHELNQSAHLLYNLQQELEQQTSEWTQERDLLQQELDQKIAEWVEERDRLQQALEQQRAALLQDCDHLQQQLQQQKTELTEELTQNFRHHTFTQLQTLLVGYPSASKIAHAKPDLPAKNLIAMFTPLENLLQDWGYEAIGPIWSRVAYDPQLHQADSAQIQSGDSVYIRFVGYRNNETILCPAKVSRTLPGAKPGK